MKRKRLEISWNLDRSGLNGRIGFLNQFFHAVHEFSVPNEIVRGERVILAAPVLAELGGGRRSAVIAGSNPGGPFHGLLLGQ